MYSTKTNETHDYMYTNSRTYWQLTSNSNQFSHISLNSMHDALTSQFQRQCCSHWLACQKMVSFCSLPRLNSRHYGKQES